ncbi:enoyl-CoA hydratase/isomerase family protein [Conexibacter woesei]|uniref:enoyl-CoA hydratase n=1 Tax=Conexibacter woesei (strain DSM 14684 / CCUG 47730 / CIP 108061 / JCM 11494 / NBRC 100937 / ID131577) TaxID=469383 RepID=D3F4A0_CONWI|nr:enoyl-CoA hydratase-related protein [Conexibacter woesei]ADB50472.1 Enoyl-CoA hydratase/isomerase [Conexibacter woesei DSM 14684]
MEPLVTLHVHDGVATLRIDRPPLNALNEQLLDRLRALAAEVDRRADVGAVVLTGGPKVFAAGADIKEIAARSYAEMADAVQHLQDGFSSIARIRVPVVAAIAGYALGGGCELALCADHRVAASNAQLGLPEILLGVIPGGGGTQRLARLIGPARAKQLIFSGRMLDAAEALELDLVDEVVAPERLEAHAHAWADRLARGPRHALRAAKEAIDRGLDTDLETGLAIERARFATLFATEDRTIGMESFAEHGLGKARFVGG